MKRIQSKTATSLPTCSHGRPYFLKRRKIHFLKKHLPLSYRFRAAFLDDVDSRVSKVCCTRLGWRWLDAGLQTNSNSTLNSFYFTLTEHGIGRKCCIVQLDELPARPVESYVNLGIVSCLGSSQKTDKCSFKF